MIVTDLFTPSVVHRNNPQDKFTEILHRDLQGKSTGIIYRELLGKSTRTRYKEGAVKHMV